jgi:hypothetical protein
MLLDLCGGGGAGGTSFGAIWRGGVSCLSGRLTGARRPVQQIAFNFL